MIDDIELKFPILGSSIPEHKSLSMDEFDRFNTEDLQCFFDREVYTEEKVLRAVNVPFVIVD